LKPKIFRWDRDCELQDCLLEDIINNITESFKKIYQKYYLKDILGDKYAGYSPKGCTKPGIASEKKAIGAQHHQFGGYECYSQCFAGYGCITGNGSCAK
jgi:hypothetical protein